MIGLCPYNCSNKTEYGYCKTTGCINPKYQEFIFWCEELVSKLDDLEGEQDGNK